jgi:hypothetical protein
MGGRLLQPSHIPLREPLTASSTSDLDLRSVERTLATANAASVDIEMRRVKGTLRGLDPTLLRVKGHRDLTDPILILVGSDPGTLQGRAIRVSGSRAASRVP